MFTTAPQAVSTTLIDHLNVLVSGSIRTMKKGRSRHYASERHNKNKIASLKWTLPKISPLRCQYVFVKGRTDDY